MDGSNAATEAVTPATAPVTAAQTAEKAPDQKVTDTKAAEAKTAETAPAKQQDPKEAQRFAALAKREKQIVARQQELKQREQEIQQRYAKYETYEKAAAEAKLNPVGFLESLGLSYEDVTQFVLNGGKATPDLHVKALKDDLERFKKQQVEERQKLVEQTRAEATRAEQEAIASFRVQIAESVKANSEKYEYLAQHPEDVVTEGIFRLIEETCKRTTELDDSGRIIKHGRVMSPEEAADILEQEEEARALKFSSTKKFQQKFSKAKAQPQPDPEDEGDEQRTETVQRRTLTNQMTGTTQAASQSPPKTEKEAFQRALAILEGRSS